VFDFGWAELLVIIFITVLVVGPKELPVIMRALGRVVRRIQYMRYAVTRQFDDFMKESDLEDLRGRAASEESGDTDAEIEADEDTLLEIGKEEEADAGKS
jgi:sec-independent protein translocase protein TatB